MIAFYLHLQSVRWAHLLHDCTVVHADTIPAPNRHTNYLRNNCTANNRKTVNYICTLSEV